MLRRRFAGVAGDRQLLDGEVGAAPQADRWHAGIIAIRFAPRSGDDDLALAEAFLRQRGSRQQHQQGRNERAPHDFSPAFAESSTTGASKSSIRRGPLATSRLVLRRPLTSSERLWPT